MRISTGVPTVSNGVPSVKGKVHQHQGIDTSHESYVYSGVPTGNNVILFFSFGVPTGDAI
jgi:hypothetical protein